MSHYRQVTSIGEINVAKKCSQLYVLTEMTEERKPQHCKTGNSSTEENYFKDNVCGADVCLCVHWKSYNIWGWAMVMISDQIWVNVRPSTSFKSRQHQNQRKISPIKASQFSRISSNRFIVLSVFSPASLMWIYDDFVLVSMILNWIFCVF